MACSKILYQQTMKYNPLNSIPVKVTLSLGNLQLVAGSV